MYATSFLNQSRIVRTLIFTRTWYSPWRNCDSSISYPCTPSSSDGREAEAGVSSFNAVPPGCQHFFPLALEPVFFPTFLLAFLLAFAFAMALSSLRLFCPSGRLLSDIGMDESSGWVYPDATIRVFVAANLVKLLICKTLWDRHIESDPFGVRATRPRMRYLLVVFWAPVPAGDCDWTVAPKFFRAGGPYPLEHERRLWGNSPCPTAMADHLTQQKMFRYTPLLPHGLAALSLSCSFSVSTF